MVKICKIHKKKLTPEHNEFSPGFTGRMECTDCGDNLDFWLPLGLLLPLAIISIYTATFPDVRIQDIFYLRYGTLIFGLGLLLFHFTQGSSLRVLKRMIQKRHLSK